MTVATLEGVLQNVRDAAVYLQETSTQLEEARLDEQRQQAEWLAKQRAQRVAKVAALRRAKSKENAGMARRLARQNRVKGVAVVDEEGDAQQVDDEAVNEPQVEAPTSQVPAFEQQLQLAKEKLAAAVTEARNAGAEETLLLEAGRARAVDVDDGTAIGAAARRARKFRQQQKAESVRQRQQHLEKERASRVAQALAARRAKDQDTNDPIELTVVLDGDVDSPVVPYTDKHSSDDSKSKVSPSLSMNWESGPRFGGASATTQTQQSLRFRSRSRSPGGGKVSENVRAITRVKPGKSCTAADDSASKGLASMLWSTKPPSKEASTPSIWNRSTGIQGASLPVALSSVAADLSTGGGEICKMFKMGTCFKANCRLRHIQAGRGW